MTENDDDLIRMFTAQRKVDEGLVPSFDDMEAKSHTAGDFRPEPSDGRSVSLPVRVALSAIAVSALIILAIWINTPRVDVPRSSSASRTDLQKLNQVCDSLLMRIREPDPETVTKADDVEQEMEWLTVTDSLIPFETLSFNGGRTSP